MSAELLPLLKVHEYFRGVSDESRASHPPPRRAAVFFTWKAGPHRGRRCHRC